MLNVNARPTTMLKFAKPIAIAAALAFAGSATMAQADDAKDVLKEMSDYLASQKSFSLSFDSSIEAVTPSMEKIQFNNSGTLLLKRPNEIHVTRTGGYADVELFFDGKTVSIYGKNLKKYVQMDAAGSVDQLIEALRGKGMALPGADLLLGDVFKTLTDDLLEAKHIGLGVINGVECEHLAFRQKETDWQLWVTDRRQAGSLQDGHHQQERRRVARIHTGDQGLEGRRGRRCDGVRLQAARGRDQGGAGGPGRPR